MKKIRRKEFIGQMGIITLGAVAVPHGALSLTNGEPFMLPNLKYDYADLEPYIDAQTMLIHHTKHHAGYTAKLNAAVQDMNQRKFVLEDVFKKIETYPETIRNNGGGYWNHSFFWETLTPKGTELPQQGGLSSAIQRDFGSLEKLKEVFKAKAGGQFGSGWAWLIANKGKLSVTATPNQDNPLMNISAEQGTPIIAIDVWEHAYYLKYQNKRADYIDAFWNIVDWEKAAERYKKA